MLGKGEGYQRGVSTRDTIPAQVPEAEPLVERLRAQDVEVVALSFMDNAGIARVKAVPLPRLAAAAAHGVGASPCFETYCFDDVMVIGTYLGGPDGDLRLVPDLDRLVPMAGQAGWAWAPVDKFTQDGNRFAACQRAFAAAQVRAAADRGLALRMGFETEWALGMAGTDGEFVPAFEGPAYGLARLEQVAEYARELLAVLGAQGLHVLQFHPEYAAGQLELSLAATDPVAAADEVVLVRHSVRRVSALSGWRASFAPCVVPGAVGSGAHLHLSVSSTEEEGAARSLFTGGAGPHGLHPAGEAFLAGVLRELPALVAIGAGSPASFLRAEPSRWAGVWQAWGHETREAAVRLVTGVVGTGQWAANAEVKCFDATANPYLLVGSVIAAGLAGVDDGLRLPEPITGDPALRENPGVRRLPSSGLEAAEALAGSAVLAKAMGEVLHDTVLTVRRAESERFADTSPENLAELTRWRW
ncbi:glutamine synthetase (glutamate--ammonia ligase) [Kutzneria albida DSM 43870]|uniref:Glutamine synthetase (Glutamate--ammonia ligase) n=1 Tax=Kutzneria albida DSM 43870 TaxID=1449976 RepID=W5W171_9PSEU|nr:glutamine synthetase (glutamate--ammonia ligase) [Kutzneria albida DSM 43870]